MLPVLFHAGSLGVDTHDFFVLMGVLAALGVFLYEADRRAVLSEPLLWVVVGTLFGGAVGMRASSLWAAIGPDGGAIAAGGKSILGGLSGAYFGAVATKRIVGYRGKTGDLFAPAVALGMAVGRWGCFLTEQVGTPTGSTFGVALSRTQIAHIPNCGSCVAGVPLHPSFLYEIAFHALAFVVLLRMRDRLPVPGELLKIYLFGYGTFRFVVEFVRGNPEVLAGLSMSQVFLIPSTLLLVGYFVRQFLTGSYATPNEAFA